MDEKNGRFPKNKEKKEEEVRNTFCILLSGV